MVNVELDILNNGPYLKAPDFCEYQEDEVVHASICGVCRKCNFVAAGDPKLVEFTSEQRLRISTYLTSENTTVARSLVGQHKYLIKQNRKPLMVLINKSILKQALLFAFPDDLPKGDAVLNYLTSTLAPICHTMGYPVYLSEELLKSSVQMVGEISWK